jgi:hypothetical protein
LSPCRQHPKRHRAAGKSASIIDHSDSDWIICSIR